MIGHEDAFSTYDYEEYYKILPSINNWDDDKNRIKDGKKVELPFSYDSENNEQWMSKEELSKWLDANEEIIGKFNLKFNIMIPYGRQDISKEDINAVVKVLKSDYLTQGPVIHYLKKR